MLLGHSILTAVGLLHAATLFAPLAAQDPAITLGPARRYPQPFARITAVRAFSDGRILVADRIDTRVVVIDSALRTAQPVGGEGSGPGEYRSPVDLIAMDGDSTLLADMGNMRLTVFGRDLRHIGSLPMLNGGTIFQPAGGTGPYWFFHDPDRSRPVRNNQLIVQRVDRRTGRVDTAAALRMAPQYAAAHAQGWAAPSTGLFTRDVYAVAPDGWVAIVRHAPYRVEWRAPDGRITTGPERRTTPIPVTQADKEAWASRFTRAPATLNDPQGGTARFQLPAPDLARVTFPTHFPPFLDEGTAVPAPNGDVWVRRAIPTRMGRAEYDVFDRAGALRGVVTLKAEQRVIGFTRTRVILASRDQDELDWLEVATLAARR